MQCRGWWNALYMHFHLGKKNSSSAINHSYMITHTAICQSCSTAIIYSTSSRVFHLPEPSNGLTLTHPPILLLTCSCLFLFCSSDSSVSYSLAPMPNHLKCERAAFDWTHCGGGGGGTAAIQSWPHVFQQSGQKKGEKQGSSILRERKALKNSNNNNNNKNQSLAIIHPSPTPSISLLPFLSRPGLVSMATPFELAALGYVRACLACACVCGQGSLFKPQN